MIDVLPNNNSFLVIIYWFSEIAGGDGNFLDSIYLLESSQRSALFVLCRNYQQKTSLVFVIFSYVGSRRNSVCQWAISLNVRRRRNLTCPWRITKRLWQLLEDSQQLLALRQHWKKLVLTFKEIEWSFLGRKDNVKCRVWVAPQRECQSLRTHSSLWMATGRGRRAEEQLLTGIIPPCQDDILWDDELSSFKILWLLCRNWMSEMVSQVSTIRRSGRWVSIFSDFHSVPLVCGDAPTQAPRRHQWAFRAGKPMHPEGARLSVSASTFTLQPQQFVHERNPGFVSPD
jgi:hypothetical protein